VKEVKVASEPQALLKVLGNPTYRFKRIGLEAGPLSQWLFSVLAEAELPVICVETRHMQAVLKAQINKTDRNDAGGIAQMIRVGLYRPVHVKTLRSQKLRMLLTHRKLLQSKAIAIENDLRGTLRNFGLKQTFSEFVGMSQTCQKRKSMSARSSSARHIGFSKRPARFSSSSSRNMAPILIRSHFSASVFGLTGESKCNLIDVLDYSSWLEAPGERAFELRALAAAGGRHRSLPGLRQRLAPDTACCRGGSLAQRGQAART
jgi:hypothetical protein